MNEEQIQMIEISHVFVANPRPRNPVTFQSHSCQHRHRGPKKPILVTKRASAWPWERMGGSAPLRMKSARFISATSSKEDVEIPMRRVR